MGLLRVFGDFRTGSAQKQIGTSDVFFKKMLKKLKLTVLILEPSVPIGNFVATHPKIIMIFVENKVSFIKLKKMYIPWNLT